MNSSVQPPTTNQDLLAWVDELATLLLGLFQQCVAVVLDADDAADVVLRGTDVDDRIIILVELDYLIYTEEEITKEDD